MRNLRKFINVFLIVFSTVANPCAILAEELEEAEGEADVATAVRGEDNLVSMNFDGAQLRDVLKILSQQSGLNFVASEDVESKKVTVLLEDVPVGDALESIVRANSLRYERKPGSNVFEVSAAEDTSGGVQTRVFMLRYTRLSISPLDVGGQSAINDLLKPEEVSAITASAGGAGAAAGAGAAGAESTGTELALVAERGVDKIVATLLSETGKVTVDIHTNSLIVTDAPAVLTKIEKVLEKIDVPTRQVMIECHLIEVSKTVLDDHGVDWGGANGALLAFEGADRSTAFPFAESIFTNSSELRAATRPKSAITMGTVSAENFSATLRFITSQSDSKILARPRVLTLNNEAANIRLVTSAAIARTSTITASEGITTLQTGQASRTDVGISLRMTPQVNENRTITLFVEPSVTTVAASTFFPSDFLDPTTRSVRTMARVKDHETLVIGGLIDRNHSLTDKRIPGLGSIPFFGNAFAYKERGKADRELIIFITPHIVEGYDSLAAQSATAPGRDTAVRRTLDYFVKEEMELATDPLEDAGAARFPIDRQEKAMLKQSAKRPVAPSLEKEMSRALDSLSQKNAK